MFSGYAKESKKRQQKGKGTKHLHSIVLLFLMLLLHILRTAPRALLLYAQLPSLKDALTSKEKDRQSAQVATFLAEKADNLRETKAPSNSKQSKRARIDDEHEGNEQGPPENADGDDSGGESEADSDADEGADAASAASLSGRKKRRAPSSPVHAFSSIVGNTFFPLTCHLSSLC